MVIGYTVCGPDNDSYMMGDRKNLFEDLINVPACDKCGFRTDYRYTNVYFKLRRKTSEFSYTYDSNVIVNLKFKEFCDRNGYTNVKFIELERSFGFFHMFVSGNELPYKANWLHKLCDKCGQYEEVIEPSIDTAKVRQPLKDELYHSDLWFGSGNSKSPIVIVGQETKDKMKREKFKNIYFEKIEV